MRRVLPGLGGFFLAAPLLLCACARPVPVPGPDPVAEAARAPQNVPLATHPTVGQEVGAAVANRLDVLFPKGGTMLMPDQAAQLDIAARLFRDANPAVMFVAGHTDSSGNEYANVLLSAQRAEAVKVGLVQRGMPPDRLLVQALGQSDPADAHDPSAAENRRVVISYRLF